MNQYTKGHTQNFFIALVDAATVLLSHLLVNHIISFTNYAQAGWITAILHTAATIFLYHIYDFYVINIFSPVRICEEKGVMRMIPIFARLKEQGFKFCWRVAGWGPLYEEAIALRDKYQMQGEIEFLGHLTNPYPYFKKSDLLLLPSFKEAAPMVYGEAEILGVPVLTTNTTSAVELVADRGIGYFCVLDPVFLLSHSQWEEQIKSIPKHNEKYFFVYCAEENKELIRYAKSLASEKGLELYVGDNYFQQWFYKQSHDDFTLKNEANPLETLSYLRDAEYVVTNSFHGLVTSIIFEKQFAVFLHTVRSERQTSLLNTTQLNARVVTDIDSFDIDEKIDYETSKALLDVKIKESKDFIQNEILNKK